MSARDIAIAIEGTRAKHQCKSCGRLVEWVDGRQITHGPGPRVGIHRAFVCPGDAPAKEEVRS